jgi:hypothetical protein
MVESCSFQALQFTLGGIKQNSIAKKRERRKERRKRGKEGGREGGRES